MRSLLLARRGENAETFLKLLTIVDSSADYSLWILSPLSGRCSKRKKRVLFPCYSNVQSIKIKLNVLTINAYKDVIFMRQFRQLVDFKT